MTGIWAWVGRHGRAIKLGSVAAALVLLAGGLLLGMSSAAGTGAPATLGIAPAAVQEVTSHYLVGTVVEAFTPGRFILRGRGGRYYVISYDSDTLVRRNRKPAQPGAVRRGARVIVLGEPKDGRLHADVVTVTGYAPARQVPANQNQKRNTAPAPSVTPTPSSVASRSAQRTAANPQPETTPAPASLSAKDAAPVVPGAAGRPSALTPESGSGVGTALQAPSMTPVRTLHSLFESLVAERERPTAATTASEPSASVSTTSADPPAPLSTPQPPSVRAAVANPGPRPTPKVQAHPSKPRPTASPVGREATPVRREPARRPAGEPNR